MVSIITNIAALAAQANLKEANDSSIAAVGRLSSGNAIFKTSDDVSGLAVGTILKTTVDSLKAALKNTAQASSLLNVADGALDNIQKMLSRQNELASQATSGALDPTSRSYLNAEFQALSTQIDLTSNTTNFNKIKLLDGSLYNKSAISTDIDAVRDQASTTLTVSDLTDAKTVTVNGVTFTARTTLLNDGTAEFVASAVDATAATNLVNALKTYNDYRLKNMTYSASGAVVTFTSNSSGLSGNMFTIGKSTDTGLFTGWTTASLGDIAGGIKTLGNSSMGVGGLSEHNVEIKGKVNDNIIKDLSLTKATGSISLAGLTTIAIATATNNRIDLATGAIQTSVGAGTTTAIVTLANHGLKTGDVITSRDGGAFTMDTAFVIADNGSLTISSIDRDHFLISASSGSGTAGNTASASALTVEIPHQLNINGSAVVFKSSPSAANEVRIGATAQESAINLLAYLNKSTDANIASATYKLNAAGTGIDVAYKAASDVGNNFYVTTVSPLMTLSGLATGNTLDNGTSSGIDTAGVTNNEAFIGKISGFEGKYAGSANKINLTVKVGNYTYSATNVDTNPTADTKIKFISNTDTNTNLNGGTFLIDLAANKGNTVANDIEAQKFADRINSAFAGITINQRRELTSYSAIGNVTTNGTTHGRLDGTRFEMNTKSFEAMEVESFDVRSPVVGSTVSSMSMVVNGEKFSNNNILSGIIQTGEIVALTSEIDPLNQIFFYNNADISQDFSTSDKAFSFATTMSNALGLNQGKSTLTFQIGTTTEEVISLSVQGTKTTDLFKDSIGKIVDLNISTAEGATEAINVLSSAIQKVTTIRAQIGALQSRIDKASSTIQTGIQNQDAARGVFLDTDMAAEASKFASAQVKVQASISMLAQANLLPQSLLKLLGQ